MKIKSFGCSFIFGNDLVDVNEKLGEPYSSPSKFTWPSLLAQSLGYEYECHARPGSGNLRILEKILSHASQDPYSIYVIGWSFIDRFDYTVDLTGHDHVYDVTGTSLWRTVMPIDTDHKAKIYYKDLHSQLRDKFTNLIYIRTAIDVLKQKNIKFLMTYMDELLFETQFHINPAIAELQNYISPYMTKFGGKTFLDFSKHKGFDISATNHPREPAHQAAFELIRSYDLL